MNKHCQSGSAAAADSHLSLRQAVLLDGRQRKQYSAHVWFYYVMLGHTAEATRVKRGLKLSLSNNENCFLPISFNLELCTRWL
jgi:hypothetical protein